MSKFRKKSKINVGGKLPVSSVVAVMTAFQKELSVYSQGYTQSKDIWKMYSEGVSHLDDALVSWGYKVDNIEKDVSVMISFVNSDTPRVEVVSDKAKCLLLVSTGYLVSLARRIATMNTNNEVSPSVIKMLDLVLFVRQSGLDVFETSTYGGHWQTIKSATSRGYYSRNTVDEEVYGRKELSPFLSTRYEPTAWYAVCAKNYYEYFGETYMKYFRQNVEHYKTETTPSKVIFSELAYLEANKNG